jgi:hypothetical protein
MDETTLFYLVQSEEEKYLAEIRLWLRQMRVQSRIVNPGHGHPVSLEFPQYADHDKNFHVSVNHEGSAKDWTLNIVPFDASEFPELPWSRPVTASYLIYRYIKENITGDAKQF